jgi:hypothetical protein
LIRWRKDGDQLVLSRLGGMRESRTALAVRESWPELTALTSIFLGGAAGNRTRFSTWALPSELLFRYVSFRFVTVRYLRLRSRVLTASRAVDRGLDFASIGMTVAGLRAFNVI